MVGSNAGGDFFILVKDYETEERRIKCGHLRKYSKHGCTYIFSAFMIPEDVQKELKSAGADRVIVGWPITPGKFKETILELL